MLDRFSNVRREFESVTGEGKGQNSWKKKKGEAKVI